MSDPNTGSKGWWQTLPGILTAVAAIITAVTGLLVALGGLGVFHRSPRAPSQSPSTSSSQGTPSSGESAQADPGFAHSANTDGTAHNLPLPATTLVRSGTADYKLLSLHSAPYAPGKVSLRFTIRMTNNGSGPANFWSSSFRLRVADSLEAPINLLDDLVPDHSSKEGSVEFVIPTDTPRVGFQMGEVGTDKPDIAIDLGGAAGTTEKPASRRRSEKD